MQATADELQATGNRLAAVGESLTAEIAGLRQTTDWLLASTDPNDSLAGAAPYLRQFGIVAGGYYLGRSALIAQGLLAANGADPWLQAKVDTTLFYADQILPQAAGSAPAVTVGAGQLYAIDADILGQ
jgi:acyl-CoA dehydrogenase